MTLADATALRPQTFLTGEYTHYGRYRIRLYDAPKQKYVTVVIDDW